MQPTAYDKANWAQVYSLMALNAAVVISWIAYHNYQPKVLELFQFQELSLFLVVAQAIILVFIPPLAGLIGDYFIQKNGDRFIVFMVGTSVTAMTFMAVAFTVGTANTLKLTSALPFMIVVWLISMNIFHSPANSMIELFASGKNLPLAMALLTLTTELLYALEPLVVWFVDLIGPVLTFVLGGVLLIITGVIFRKTTKNILLKREYEEVRNARITNIPLVFAVAVLLGLVSALIKNWIPEILPSKLQPLISFDLDGNLFACILLALAALAALPILQIIQNIGLKKGVIVGLILSFIAFAALVLVSNPFLTLLTSILLAVAYSIFSVSALPYALQHISAKHVTWVVGIFFGSLELADGLMAIFEQL